MEGDGRRAEDVRGAREDQRPDPGEDHGRKSSLAATDVVCRMLEKLCRIKNGNASIPKDHKVNNRLVSNDV